MRSMAKNVALHIKRTVLHDIFFVKTYKKGGQPFPAS